MLAKLGISNPRFAVLAVIAALTSWSAIAALTVPDLGPVAGPGQAQGIAATPPGSPTQPQQAQPPQQQAGAPAPKALPKIRVQGVGEAPIVVAPPTDDFAAMPSKKRSTNQ